MALTFTPHSIVYLCNVPMSADQKNQIDFSSVRAQSAYFQGRVLRSFTDFTYQRKDNIIRVPVEADAIWNCNYVMYQNANFTGKWFYAFVTEIEYRNDGCTWLHIKTDVFQTWLFNYTWRSSFIVREHVADDTIGLHTIPENIPIGDPIIENYTDLFDNMQARTYAEYAANYVSVFIMSEFPSWVTPPSSYNPADFFIGGIQTGAYFLGVEPDNLFPMIEGINQGGQAEAVVAIVPMPRQYITLVPYSQFFSLVKDAASSSFKAFTPNYSTIDGYAPKNNKCFCYPYHYALLSNHAGQENTYKYEEMHETGAGFAFHTEYITGANPAIIAYPEGYTSAIGEDHSVTLANFPQISWKSNAYQNWLALNANSMMFGMGSQILNLGVQGTVGNIGGMLGAGMTIGSELASMEDMKNKPDTLHNTVSGNFNMYANCATITYYEMCCRAEYIKIVDQYFQRYGYRVNAVRVPNLQSRPKWNYIETRDCCLDVDAPEDDAQELENIFNSGVTIWHDASAYGNYTLDNSP